MGRAWHHRLLWHANGLDRHGFALTIEQDRAPSEADREALSARHQALTASLAHQDDDAVRREIAAFIATYRIGRYSTEEARFTVTSYARTLSDLPAWAVIATIQSMARNHDGPHPPTAGQIYRAAQERCRHYHDERQKIADVLTARVVEPMEPTGRPTMKALRERYGENFGLVEDPAEAAAAARRAAALQRSRDAAEKLRRRELEAAGIDPATTPCSLAVLRSKLVRKEQQP